MKTICLLFIVLHIFCIKLYSQGEANTWYFGGNAGIDFNGGELVNLNNSAMTPQSGSDYNNTFGLNTDKLKFFKIWIYDRWGNQLFYSQDVEKTWDGTYKDNLVPNGIYTYKIEIIDLGYRHVDIIGTVTVM